MTAEELQAWLEENIDLIVVFMDYEPTIDSDEELAMTLGFWFDNDAWNTRGDSFAHLGIDGMGSQFAAWTRPGDDGPPPIVYFGSEGGAGVLARTPLDWAMALAHAPGINEYSDEGPAELDPEANWMMDDEQDEDMIEEARSALATYRESVQSRFGSLSDLDSVTADLDELNAEFAAWIAERTG